MANGLLAVAGRQHLGRKAAAGDGPGQAEQDELVVIDQKDGLQK